MAFQQVLRNVCNLTAAAANAIIAQGVVGPEDLVNMEDKDIDNMIKHTLKANAGAAAPIAIPYVSIVTIKAFRYWAITRGRIGMALTSADFDAAELAFTQELIRERRDRKAAAQKEPEKPPELKDLSEWRNFWEKWDTYMTQTYGAAEIPLSYVYREHEAVTAEMRAADYTDNDSRYYTITVLAGSHYREDNKRVYEELKTLLINGPGWTFIKRYERTQNGRAAVLAIKQQAEGRSATDSRKQRAYASIATARYAGPRRNWNFQKYVQKHQDGHNELADLGEPVPETKKVTDFLAGISDPRLSNAKDIVLGNPQYLQDFELTQQYFATLVGNKAEQSKMERQISEVKRVQWADKNKDKYKNLKSGTYSKAEWNKLGPEGQAKVRALRAQKKKARADAKRKAEIAQLDTQAGGAGGEQEEDCRNFGAW